MRERPIVADSASLSIDAGASCPIPLGRLDLKPGIVQPLNDDLGRVFGVKDLCREIAAAEEIGHNVLGSELAHAHSAHRAIGPATSAKMNSLGLYTGLDMRKQSLDFMQANFGKAGSYCYWISRGIDNREVRANRIRKSVGAENTFADDLTEFEVMLSELQPLIDKVWRHCEDKGARGWTVTLKVKFADFELISRSRTSVGAIGCRDELESASAELLKSLFPLQKPVRLLGVAISGFSIAAFGRSEQIGT